MLSEYNVSWRAVIVNQNKSGAPLFQSEATNQGADGPLRNDTPLEEPVGPSADTKVPQTVPGVNEQKTGPPERYPAQGGFAQTGDPVTTRHQHFGCLLAPTVPQGRAGVKVARWGVWWCGRGAE